MTAHVNEGLLRRFGGLVVIGAVLALLPLILPNNFYLDLVIRMGINAIVVIALNLLAGYTGQISLGHAGFMGIGAYSTAILTVHFNWPPFAALLAGMVASGVLALLVARPILKLKGHYLAMATLGLGMIISIAITNEAKFTGGPDGITVPALSFLGIEINGEKQWYWVVAALLLLVLGGAINLVNSPAGRALQSIHGSEVAARVVGVDTAAFKTKMFVFSAVIASFMGSVAAHYVGFLTPGIAGFFHSVELMTMVVVGGMASIYGSVLGAVLLTLLPQLLAKFEGWETVAFGAILMLTMIFLPKGVVPSLSSLWRKKGN
ncbi:branched-chain amino acid ABC transporter permease [Noviherbaspirillum sedimenti]|uniref:Branched-chain amino acid ABC transporter permease n=2 Tax=Noviherbaspirillum sedimenti TaxID=2320865 RepID=A0A3A3G273_9BURK|nr:branched-chain amino acid ABC transporter permease [Noviherbaspirillum sedimenti]